MKSLKGMQAEVVAVVKENGWYEDDRTFGESMALLHSEVSEALEAYRKWGVEDATEKCVEASFIDPSTLLGHPLKPEGIGSEFADILIRLLDDCERYGVDLEDELGIVGDAHIGVWPKFGENMNALHTLIAFTSERYYTEDDVWRQNFADIYSFLCGLCDLYGINLEAEYERKLAFNRTRPYRHGGKKL